MIWRNKRERESHVAKCDLAATREPSGGFLNELANPVMQGHSFSNSRLIVGGVDGTYTKSGAEAHRRPKRTMAAAVPLPDVGQ